MLPCGPKPGPGDPFFGSSSYTFTVAWNCRAVCQVEATLYSPESYITMSQRALQHRVWHRQRRDPSPRNRCVYSTEQTAFLVEVGSASYNLPSPWRPKRGQAIQRKSTRIQNLCPTAHWSLLPEVNTWEEEALRSTEHTQWSLEEPPLRHYCLIFEPELMLQVLKRLCNKNPEIKAAALALWETPRHYPLLLYVQRESCTVQVFPC